MKEYINNIETLEQLIEEHKNCKTKVKIYEFDNTSYTLLLIEINKILKENQKLQKESKKLKQQLEQRDNIINKAREKCKNKGKMDYDVWLYLSETIKTLEGFSKHIDYNLHPIITEAYKCEVRNCINELCEVVKYKLIYKDELLEILDKGDE